MIRGGVPSWALYIKGGARFGRMYKCRDMDDAIEIGHARFLKPLHAELDDKGNPLKDETGKEVKKQTNPPITFWKRLKAAKLYLVAEGHPLVLNWLNLINGLVQQALTPEQLKKDPQVAAVSAAVKTFGKGGLGNWMALVLVIMGLAIGFFMAFAFAAAGVLPV